MAIEKNKNRMKQINKEAIITVVLYLFYFCWWYYFAYVYVEKGQKFIFGLPRWFFYSCVLGLGVINLLVYIVVKIFFKETKLD